MATADDMTPDGLTGNERPRGGAAVIPPSPAPRETLQDFVYRALKDLILDGGIQPGRMITIPSLAAAYAVSNMPVREALRRLTAERALTVVSGRSVGVPSLSVERLDDLRRVRIEIEGLAAAWAAERIEPDAMAQLGELAGELDSAAETGEVGRYLGANRRFHFAAYAAAGSPALLGMIESLWLQISPYFGLLHASGNYAEANLSHRALVAALRRADPPAARAAIRNDIEGAASALRPLLESVTAASRDPR